jgi:hypothetical protein
MEFVNGKKMHVPPMPMDLQDLYGMIMNMIALFDPHFLMRV